jgi:putative ABC transport system substrate-binding protein
MRRREFLGALGGAAAAWPLAARAQQPAAPVVGFFHGGSRDAFSHLATGFRQGLAASDFVEGQNVAVEYRWAEGQLDRLPALAADLMGRHRLALMAGSLQAIRRVRTLAPILPTVFVTAEDPVKLGLIESLSRPGGNATGAYLFTSGLEAKRLGLLKDLVPKATTVAVLVDPDYGTVEAQARDVREAAIHLGLQVVVVLANSDRDVEAAFATFVERRAEALMVGASPSFNNRRDRLIALSARYRLPTIYEVREFVAAGGLMSYGNDIADSYRQIGVYAGRILKGATPADLPVIQPSKFHVAINLKTAKTLGVDISGNLLTLADEVID